MVKKYTENDIETLATLLKNNGVISVPTDTVYGLCTPINSKIGYKKLINIKNRPANKLFPIMCANEEQIKSICIITKREEAIIKALMPGPITLVLKRKKSYKLLEFPTIAVRMATSKALENLIKLIDQPVFMTSANISNELPCNSIKDIEKTFPNLDGILLGNTKLGESSTILDCTKAKLSILREGPIQLEKIEEIIKSM